MSALTLREFIVSNADADRQWSAGVAHIYVLFPRGGRYLSSSETVDVMTDDEFSSANIDTGVIKR